MSSILLQALCATLDQLSAGFVACFADGRILHANRAAQDMLALGWPIRKHNGYLQGNDRKRTEIILKGLQTLSEKMAIADGGDMCLDICLAGVGSAHGAAIASLRPLLVPPAPYDPAECVVAFFVTQIGSRDRSALCGIAQCFDLTRAETRALKQFVEGGTVAEVAQRLDISENTVKTHLQNIFTKTSSSRQPELMQLVNELQPPLRSPASVAANGHLPSRRPNMQRDDRAIARHIQ